MFGSIVFPYGYLVWVLYIYITEVKKIVCFQRQLSDFINV